MATNDDDVGDDDDDVNDDVDDDDNEVGVELKGTAADVRGEKRVEEEAIGGG